jgi:hypothetical protein
MHLAATPARRDVAELDWVAISRRLLVQTTAGPGYQASSRIR